MGFYQHFYGYILSTIIFLWNCTIGHGCYEEYDADDDKNNGGGGDDRAKTYVKYNGTLSSEVTYYIHAYEFLRFL